ncbi:MAG TPA: 50S ribosomal protein L30 [Thermomicrobiales bacterium]|nr:50S ribosomal protein L30 [Thermomicrobiales bacterium]
MEERATGAAAGKRLRITWVKSAIGYRHSQRRNITSLGLRRLNQTVEHYDTPTIRGMIAKVHHLVRVEDVPAGTPPPPARETGAQRFAARMAKKQAAREALAAALFGDDEETDGAASAEA